MDLCTNHLYIHGLLWDLTIQGQISRTQTIMTSVLKMCPQSLNYNWEVKISKTRTAFTLVSYQATSMYNVLSTEGVRGVTLWSFH